MLKWLFIFEVGKNVVHKNVQIITIEAETKDKAIEQAKLELHEEYGDKIPTIKEVFEDK